MKPRRLAAAGIPGAGFAAFGLLAAQVWWAGHRPLPYFRDLNPSGAFGSRDAREVRLGALGDSTMTGPGLPLSDHIWVRRVARRLATDYRVRLYSRAFGGAKARDVLEYQVDEMLPLRPQIALVSVGGNDALRGTPMRRYEAELHEICTRLLEVADRIVLPGIGDLGTIPRLPRPLSRIGARRGRACDRVHRRVAEMIDGVAYVPMTGSGISAFKRDPRNMFAPDLFHPSEHGHALWADAIYPTLRAAVGDLAPLDLLAPRATPA